MLIRSVIVVLTVSLSLTGCKSAEERAEEHYQNGLTLMAEGDPERAIIEFRNVFRLDEDHREAREALAGLFLEQRKIRPAYRQYLLLAEQYPDDLEARIVLGELAFRTRNWEELERHTTKAQELSPDTPRVQALTRLQAYQKAVLDEDSATRREEARQAEALLETLPENEGLRKLLMDHNMREGNYDRGLAEMDWLLERNPDDADYWRERLNILAQMEDYEALEAQLVEMIDRFPDDDTHKSTLLRYYMSRGQVDEAETFLRGLADASDDIRRRIDLVRFVTERRGNEAGLAELETALVDHPNDLNLQALAAALEFSSGRQDVAISALEEAIEVQEALEEPSENLSDVKAALARMLLATDNEVGARALVEEIISEDPSNALALKLKAGWLIEADNPDEAIAALRTALDTESEDSEAMTLMAQAYSRAGQPNLARDYLALAVNASGNAPDETLRYARVLIENESYLPAEDILLAALRLDPNNIDLLTLMGQLYLAMDDMGRSEQVAQSLRRLDDPRATQAAIGLEAERINRQDGADKAISFLENIASGTDASLNAKLALVRARLSTGDPEGALELARQIQQDAPDNESLQATLASVEALNGNLEEAEKHYTALLDSNAARPGIWLELMRLKLRQSDPDGADTVLQNGLEALPGDPNLMWAQASVLEREGNIDAAIEIYETLYEQNSNSAVIANNLASLISTYRTDEESLERAWIIARRLRDAELPPLQDTYGWILHRRGESAEALPYLESAAAGLPNDPLVQYHLAEVYLALARPDEALIFYRNAVDAASGADQRPQMVRAREQVRTLPATIEAETGDQ